MRRRHSSGPSNFTIGAAVLIVAVILTYLGFTKSIPFRHHYEIHAVFRTANNVKPGSPVRIAGVNVGKVTGVDHLPSDRNAARVTMRIDKKGLPIHKDATVQIRPRIFLEGNFFVDVHPGSPSAPTLGDGDTIPVNQTSAPVQIDQILGTLQTDTRKDLRRVLDELSTGLAGQGGAGFNRSIPYWKNAYERGAIASDASLGETQHDLSGYIKNAGATAEALDRNDVQLKSLITDFNTTAHAFAVNDTALGDAIAELPRTLRAGRPALASLNAAFPPLRRFIRDFRPAVRSSGPALTASIPFAQQARLLVAPSELRGLVHDLVPTVPALTKLQKATLPLYEQVRAASSCQNEVILPWSHDQIQDSDFPTNRKVYEESTGPLGGLAGESRSGDANGQWFRVLVSAANYAYPLGSNWFLTAQPLKGVNPAPPAQKYPRQYRPDVPCETQQPPDLRSNPLPAPQGTKVDLTSAAAQAANATATTKAVDWLRGLLQREGSQLKVASTPLKSLSEVKK
ncbi:MAG: MCE family protein [Actinobacteria bacterium]|nr:MAG: MCE family protein [Actinomycetota bacterium]